MSDKYFYTSGTEGIEYTTADEIAAWLQERPDEIKPYHQKMYDLADNFAGWKDYKGMRQALMMLVDTLAKLQNSKRVGDDPPLLTEEDEKILDEIWDKHGRENGIVFPPKPREPDEDTVDE